MATFREVLAILVEANVGGAVQGLEKVGKTSERELGKATTRTDQWSKRLTIAGAGAVGFAAIAGRGLLSFANASEEAHHNQLILDNTLANMPKLAGENRKSFIDLAQAIQHKTAADGDQIVSAEGLLGTFQLTGDEIRGLTPLVVDYARKFNTDLKTAAIQVGKAMDGQVGALKRNGVSIDENLFKTDRYAAVQKALSEQVGGFAEAEGKTFAGSLQRLKNELGDVAEGIGTGVVPAVQSMISPVGAVTDKFTSLNPEVQKGIGTIATWATVGVGSIGAVSFAAGQMARLKDRFTVVDAVTGTSSLNNWGKAAGVAGIAAVGLGVVLAGLGAENAKAEQKVDDLKKSVQELGVSLGEAAAQKLAEFVGEHEKARRVLDETALSVEDVSRAIQGSDRDFSHVHDTIAAYADAMGANNNREAEVDARKLNKEIGAQHTAFLSAKGEIKGTNKATDDLRGTQLDATKAAEGLTGATDEDTAATDENTDAKKELADAIDAAKKRLDELAEAQRAEVDRLQDSAEAQLSYQDQVDETQTKIVELGKAHFKTGQEEQAAIRDVEQAFLAQGNSAVAAYEKAKGGALTAEQANGLLRGEYQKLADKLAPGSPLRVYLQGLIDKLNEASLTRTSHLNVEINTPSGVGVHVGGGVINRFAGGGVVPGPIGKPQLAIVEGGETVLDTHKPAGSRHQPAVGGNVTYVNVTMNVPIGAHGAQVGRQFFEYLKQYERASGPLQLRVANGGR